MKTIPFVLFIHLIMFSLSSSIGFAQEDLDKEAIIQTYETAVLAVEELNVYQEDVFDILPKVKLAGNALMRDDLKRAKEYLISVEKSIELLKVRQSKKMLDKEKMQWLKVYVEAFQKFLLLAILSFLFVKWPLMNRMPFFGRANSKGKRNFYYFF